ncbi:MAG: DUF2335 domain-containing protein [Desulfotignum sp.]|nr:DUF2335 domain-containing protein [Desulfotignum sp.]MCF8114661.1 DUF2335 domain-containing protein [Desulfotignum sp.]
MSKNKQNSPAAKAKSRQANGTLMAVGQQFSGPIPPPDILEKYENILPGAMDRIIAMAENESKHRHEMKKTVVAAEIKAMESEAKDTRRGQYCGLIIGVTALISGAYAAVNGAPIAGGLIGTGGVLGLVSAFIGGRYASKPSKPSNPSSPTP